MNSKQCGRNAEAANIAKGIQLNAELSGRLRTFHHTRNRTVKHITEPCQHQTENRPAELPDAAEIDAQERRKDTEIC